MDKRKNNGGHSTAGFAGRKPKSEENTLIEKLTPLEEKAFVKLSEAIDSGKDWAIKLFFQYKFGMPKQVLEQTTNIKEVPKLVFVKK